MNNLRATLDVSLAETERINRWHVDGGCPICATDDEDWSCIDCGIPLEPGAPPICEECLDD